MVNEFGVPYCCGFHKRQRMKIFYKVTMRTLSSIQVEYLREELGQAKAKLAESEFFREKALLELR